MTARVPSDATERDFGGHAETADRTHDVRTRERALRTQADLVSIAAHALRTPLSTISVTVAAMQRSPPNQRAARFPGEAERILRNVRRMNLVLRDLVDFFQIEAGVLQVDLGVHAIGELLEATIEAVRPIAGRRRLELVVDPIDHGIEITCDRVRILQALGNLLDNAVKFTGADGHITVRFSRAAGEAFVDVSDDGRGIAREEWSGIFLPEWRTRPRERAKQEGLGLGLYITRSLIEAQGGRVSFESERGRGTTFRVMLGTMTHPRAARPAAETAPSVSQVVPAVAGLVASARDEDTKPLDPR